MVDLVKEVDTQNATENTDEKAAKNVAGKATEKESTLQADTYCSSCNKGLSESEGIHYEGDDEGDEILCADCCYQLEQEYKDEQENISIPKAVFLGITAAIIGTAIGSAIEILTDRITAVVFPFLVLLLGYFIGVAVRYGAGKKRGRTLQIISGVITFVSIIATSNISYNYFTNKQVTDTITSHGSAAPDFVYISPLDPVFIKILITPALFVWAVGLIIAYLTPGVRKLRQVNQLSEKQ